MQARDYDSTVARMAGNIAAGLVTGQEVVDGPLVAQIAVSIARMILAETYRTEAVSGTVQNYATCAPGEGRKINQ